MSRYPALIAELRDRGWSDADSARLTSGNILRVLRDAEAAAAEIGATPRAVRGPHRGPRRRQARRLAAALACRMQRCAPTVE